MSRKTPAALIAELGINFALASGALFLANLNKPSTYAGDDAMDAAYSDIKQVAGKPVDAEAGDLAVPLKAAQQGGNTRVTFRCGKDMGPAGREEHEGTWDQIAGAVLYRPEQQQLIAVEAVFDTRSLRTDAHGLTQTVTTKEKWFDIDKHPKATFTCDRIEKVESDAATPSHTHELIGEFTLNGITKAITIPATLAFAGQSLTLDAAFTILRSDYDVEKRASSLAGSVGGAVSKVDDEVELAVRVTASPDPMAVLSELAQENVRHQSDIHALTAELKQVKGSLSYFADQTAQLEQKIEELGYSVVKQVDLSQLPGTYTDHVQTTDELVPFDMVLVQGDSEKDIDAFYLARHEVTWGMMTDWLYSAELDAVEAAREIDAGLRPSPLWGTLSEQFQVSDKDHPAMGMTRLTAESFCKWLSKKTGRKYRLPTEAEWLHALQHGGGIPDDIDASAWHAKNAAENENSGIPITSPVGTKSANALGIHDMLGSVAEWVTHTGKQHYVVGGSINTLPDQIDEKWRAVEDVSVWSASYPNLPYSRYWYVDFYYTGIRLVCEPASVAANPPKVGEAEE